MAMEMMGAGPEQMPQGMMSSPYPSGDDVMAQGGPMGAGPGGEAPPAEEAEQQNPVTESLSTLALFVRALRERGNEKPMAKFIELIDAIQSGGMGGEDAKDPDAKAPEGEAVGGSTEKPAEFNPFEDRGPKAKAGTEKVTTVL